MDIKKITLLFCLFPQLVIGQVLSFRYDSTLVKSGFQNLGDCSAYNNFVRSYIVVTDTDSTTIIQYANLSAGTPIQNETRQSYTFDSLGRIRTLTAQFGDTTAWYNYMKEYYTLDASDRNILTIALIWSTVDSAWRNNYYDSTQYYISGLVSRTVHATWDTLSAGWIQQFTADFQYNSQGSLTDRVTLNYDQSGQLVQGQHLQKTYSANDTLIDDIDQRYDTQYSFWRNYSRTEYFLDAFDRDTMQIQSTGDSISWLPGRRILKSYSASGKVLQTTNNIWQSSTWFNTSRITNQYNGLDQLVQVLQENGTGTQWSNYSLQFLSYTPTNKLSSISLQGWDGTQWVNGALEQYSYDGADSLVETLDLSWNQNFYDSTQRSTTTYFSYFPLSRYVRSEYYSPGIGWFIATENMATYDQANHLIYSWFDGHAGSSGGEYNYVYSQDGDLVHEYGYSCSMGGLGDIKDLYYYPFMHLDVNLPSTAICAGDSLQAQVSLVNCDGTCTYLWSPSTGVSGVLLPEPYLSPVHTTIYELTARNDSGSVSIRRMQVNLSPSSDLNLGEDTLLCTGTSYTLDAGTQFSQYAWQDGSSQSSFTFTTGAPGMYAYWVSVTDSNSCQNTDSINVTVDACNGIEDLHSENLRIYPNPADGLVCISGLEAQPASTLILRNAEGSIVYQTDPSQIEKCFDTSALSSGIYFCTCSGDRHETVNRKVVVMHPGY